ncbi:hypothetical protein C8D94_102144 [Marinirhabdus gelatinilytica]|uniref:Uncharacterized protein n=2 Tax=Marinirhabdus gelatinilytica TaxID=1703343 RepID=A0A370QF22_9FLAO|nr:hypothetical protein C8D94_102144 [Marinirhabdus gelatinilytica]
MMKTIVLIAAFVWFAVPHILYSQIGGSVFEVTRKAQKKAKGEADDEAEEAQEAEDMKNFEEGLENFSKELGDLGERPVEVNCMALLSFHAHSLTKQQELIESPVASCHKSKELLEAQALMLLSAGTQIYCPEELYADKLYYGRMILTIYFSVFIEKDDHYELIKKAFKRLKEASLKFGNPHSEILRFYDYIQKEILRRKENGENLEDFDAILKDAMGVEETA